MGVYGRYICLNEEVSKFTSSINYKVYLREIQINKDNKKYLQSYKQSLSNGYKRNITRDDRDKLIKIIDEYLSTFKTESNTKDIRKKLDKKIKELINKYNADEKTQKEIRNNIDKEISNGNMDKDDCGKYYNSGAPKLSFVIEEESENEVTYLLYDGPQMMRALIMIDVIEKIIKDLKNESDFRDIIFSSGDGDEGCLYVEF